MNEVSQASPVLSTEGVHHITLNGADRQTSMDFWQNIMGMKFVFEQPNLDDHSTNHLYFDPGDGRLITIFTREDRVVDRTKNPNDPGNLHHLAFQVSKTVYDHVGGRLKAAGYANSGEVDRGFMDSLYFRDPLGQLMELACYNFEPPEGFDHATVLAKAHEIRVAANALNITKVHLDEAAAVLTNQS